MDIQANYPKPNTSKKHPHHKTYPYLLRNLIITDVLKSHHVSISMGGKAAWRDNVFVERLWRSVKYEEVYLNAYDSMSEAKKRIGNWISYYNEDRKHQALGATPIYRVKHCFLF